VVVTQQQLWVLLVWVVGLRRPPALPQWHSSRSWQRQQQQQHGLWCYHSSWWQPNQYHHHQQQ
jgi:hypothetical protein